MATFCQVFLGISGWIKREGGGPSGVTTGEISSGVLRSNEKGVSEGSVAGTSAALEANMASGIVA